MPGLAGQPQLTRGQEQGNGTAVRDSDELTVIRGLAQASSSMAYPHQGDGASAAPIA
jgi:hypothetical protein